MVENKHRNQINGIIFFIVKLRIQLQSTQPATTHAKVEETKLKLDMLVHKCELINDLMSVFSSSPNTISFCHLLNKTILTSNNSVLLGSISSGWVRD